MRRCGLWCCPWLRRAAGQRRHQRPTRGSGARQRGREKPWACFFSARVILIYRGGHSNVIHSELREYGKGMRDEEEGEKEKDLE